MLEGNTQKQTLLGNRASLIKKIEQRVKRSSQDDKSYKAYRNRIKKDMRCAFYNESIIAFERPAGTISPDTTIAIKASLNLVITSQTVTLLVKELGIPYDMIIGRKSIIEQNLLQFDKDHNINTVVEPTQPLAEPPAKEAAVIHSTPQHDVSDDLLEEMWLLFERVKLIHSTECPAGESSLWYRPVDTG